MKVKGGWKFFVLALVIVVTSLASAFVVPIVGGAVARVGGDGSTAADVSERVSVRRESDRRDHADACAGESGRHVSERDRLRRLID